MECDVFIFAGEMSGDLHGQALIQELLLQNKNLKILAVAGPNMRKEPIETFLPMEKFQTMGFFDLIPALPKLIFYFFHIRNLLLKIQPKIAIFIDYPDFCLRLEKSLRKKNFSGKIIHYICPTVWAWRKNRISTLVNNLDALLTIFPFEKELFSRSSLQVEYVGHPLISSLKSLPTPENSQTTQNSQTQSTQGIGIFPGSRKTEIQRNFPLQLKAANHILQQKKLPLFLFVSQEKFQPLLVALIKKKAPHLLSSIKFVLPQEKEAFFKKLDFAIAKSGTIALELALRKIPAVVTFAIRSRDLFIARKILKIDLPFYCMVNILAKKELFPELFGPNLTEQKLFYYVDRFLHSSEEKALCRQGCENLLDLMGDKKASVEAAKIIKNFIDKHPQEKT